MTTPLQRTPSPGFLRFKRPAALILILLGVAVAGGLSLRTAPQRREQALREASLPDLQVQIAREPKNARAFYYLSIRLRDIGQVREAANALEQGAKLAPDDEQIWLEWARAAYRDQGAMAAYKIVDQFADRHPNSARSHNALASLYVRNGYWSSALDEASKATSLDASDLESWQTMGMAGLRIQDYDRAKTGFQHAVTLAPHDWHGYIGLSEVYSAQGRSQEAVSQCREAVGRASAEPETHLQLGKMLLHTAGTRPEVEEALHELRTPLDQKAILTPDQAFFAAFYLGQCYERLSDWREARVWLERSATMSPNDPTVQHDLATVYQRLGDRTRLANAVQRQRQINTYLSEAKALSDRIAGTPTDLEARLKLARLHASQGDVVDALKDYGLLLLRDPNRTVARQEYEALKKRYEGGTP